MSVEPKKRFPICCVLIVFLAAMPVLALEDAASQGEGRVWGAARSRTAGTISFDFENVPIDEVLAYIAEEGDLCIALEGDIEAPVTLKLRDVQPGEALSILAKQVGARVEREAEQSYRVRPTPLMSANYTNAPIQLVLAQLSKQSGANVVVSSGVKGKVNVQLRNVPWLQALEVVVRSAGHELVEEEGGILRVVTAQDLKDQVATRVFELRYVQPPDVYRPLMDTEFAVGGSETESGGAGEAFTLLNSVVNALSENGSVEYEPSSNSLVVTDIKPRLEEVARIIEMVDVPPPQVFVDIKFVSTDKTDLTDFGVDWPSGFTMSARASAMTHRLPFSLGSGGLEDILSVIDNGPLPVDFADAGFVFGTIDFTDLAAVLSLLKRDESTTILQAPRLVTLDNEEATIFVGETVRFAETFSASGQAGTVQRGIREAAGSPVQTGFQLLIIPHVVRGTDEVILTLIPEDSSLVGRAGQTIPGFETFTSGEESIELPQLSSRTVVTKVLVRHGQTLVLGGLMSEVDSQTERRVPFFSDAPLLGGLFKKTVVSKETRNLMIFATVMIERTPEDSDAVYRAHRRHEAEKYSPVQYLTRPVDQLVERVESVEPGDVDAE